MKINDLMAILVAELEEGEVPNPLAQDFTLAHLWTDLARLAGEDLPPEVEAATAPLLAETIEPTAPIRRGSYADPALQFPDLGDLTITDVLQRSPSAPAVPHWADAFHSAD